MISIEKCRELIGDKNLTDDEIIEIRKKLYELGEFALECYFKEKTKDKLLKLTQSDRL